MHLNSVHERLLRGEGGDARQLAMQVLAKVGSAASIKGGSVKVVLAG